jgi:hypothetical protein
MTLDMLDRYRMVTLLSQLAVSCLMNRDSTYRTVGNMIEVPNPCQFLVFHQTALSGSLFGGVGGHPEVLLARSTISVRRSSLFTSTRSMTLSIDEERGRVSARDRHGQSRPLARQVGEQQGSSTRPADPVRERSRAASATAINENRAFSASNTTPATNVSNAFTTV